MSTKDSTERASYVVAQDSCPGPGSRKVQPEDYDDDHFEADDGLIDDGNYRRRPRLIRCT